MTDYAALKTEILKPEYDGLTDIQVAAAVNAKTTTAKRDIISMQAINALIFTNNGDWGNIVGVVNGIISEPQQADRLRSVSMMELFSRNQTVETSDDAKWTMLIATVDALVSGGRMSAAGKNALVALGRPTISLAASMGWPQGVGDGDVAAARVWNG